MLPISSFKNPLWNSVEKELWPIIAKSLNTRRLARQVSYLYMQTLTCICKDTGMSFFIYVFFLV